jgi:HD-GYP domain-containing protein (c-di-GMP phosphodiesterase class II)
LVLDRLTLRQDLVDARGNVLASRGQVVSADTIREAMERAKPAPRRMLAETFVARDIHTVLAEAVYQHLFRGIGEQARVARAILAVELPAVLFDELLAVKAADTLRYQHSLVTAAVATRMLTAAVGEPRALPEVSAAALLHDLGMRHVAHQLAPGKDFLLPGEVMDVAAHPLLGAYHLAGVLGDHPAVAAALFHHWRCGQGYPRVRTAPPRSVEVIAVAAEFAALTQPRPFRSNPYTARGAADVLVAEALSGDADLSAVKLLVHALRGGLGSVRELKFAREREGQAPELNRYRRVVGVGGRPQ